MSCILFGQEVGQEEDDLAWHNFFYETIFSIIYGSTEQNYGFNAALGTWVK